MSIRVVQLTDLHLFSDPSGRLRGVPTRDALLDVLEFLESQSEKIAYLILTGDLAHDEQRETYVQLRELLSPWMARIRLIPGNHDSRPFLREVFGELVPTGNEVLTFSLAAGRWRLIGLDSHVPDEVPGRIEPEQLDWLEEELTAHSEEPTILFMHHPPIPVKSAWLDRLGLHKPERLIEIISAWEQVRVVCAGHVHHEYESRIGRVAFYTTPSTAVQFSPGSNVPVYDAAPPGYRVFTLDGDAYRTAVVRLPALHYPPAEE